MIGQSNILNYIDGLSDVPHFIVLIGDKGSGKTMVAKHIATKLNATFSICGIKVDEIRDVINTAYTVRDNILYCIKDGDTMRAEAKNAMLKITEEPPEHAYFVLTVQDESSLLATIKSRAIVIEMEPYTEQDLMDYYTQNYDGNPKYYKIATTPYEMDKMVQYGQDFIDYVELVMDNIADVEPANAFKSAGKLAIKNEDGYDLKLFWNVFIQLCIDRLSDDPLKYAIGACETIPYQMKISKLGVNKQQVYDSWVFKIREVWQ